MKFGESNSNWRGDTIGYRAAHVRVNSIKGHATEHQCYCCGEDAHEWSYDGCDPSEQVDARGRTYSPRPEHYDPFCRPCHRFNDRIYRNAVRAAEQAAQDAAQHAAELVHGDGDGDGDGQLALIFPGTSCPGSAQVQTRGGRA